MAQYMPARGERSAPTFDKAKPRELSRFFAELERLFVRVGVTAAQDMKDDVLRYVDFDVEQIWKTFPEYADITKSYLQFKAAILVHYPDATGDYVYALRDMDSLIGDYQRSGIHTTDNLQAFHLQFLAITTWLIEKGQMSDLEQRRAYIRVFQHNLLSAINNRLQMKFLAHHPNVPHIIQDVHEAARYVLHSTDATAQHHYAPVTTPVVTTSPSAYPVSAPQQTSVKVETFASAMADLKQTIIEAMAMGSRSRITAPTSQRNTDCNFCGGPHFIRDCTLVEEYIVAGKCRRNFEGKVVLSTGAFVPRDIPGTLLCERVDEWHRRFPNQLSVAAALLHTISPEQTQSHIDNSAMPIFQLSAADRITALEAELYTLRARRPAFTPIVRTRAQRANETEPSASIEEVDDAEFARDLPVKSTAPKPAGISVIPSAIISAPQPAVAPAPIIAAPPIVIRPSPPVEPEHPYQLAKDAAYAPPASRNVGAQAKIPFPKATVPAYKTLPPIHDPAIATAVYKRAMDTPITITQEELLSISPEVRSQVRESTTTKRVPTAGSAPIQGHMLIIEEDSDDEPEVVPTFSLTAVQSRVPPAGATIVADPIETYYKSLAPGETPSIDRLTVAKEATALRSIYALVDTSQKKECTVDPGCQVVAMSETTCHSLGLAYDPAIKLNMESANGTYDWSLGLARNIPFLVGTITLYLQVHIIRSPSYEILLGRPFDVLTGSVIRNYTNEDQTITITDPNSQKQCTIPTFARGTNPSASVREDF